MFGGDRFLATNGREESTEPDSSLFNSAEVSAVFDVIKSIQNTFDEPTKIAVLTSYREQVWKENVLNSNLSVNVDYELAYEQ